MAKLNRARLGEWVNEHYTLGEEIAHSVSHGVGVVLAIVGLALLLPRAALHGCLLYTSPSPRD